MEQFPKPVEITIHLYDLIDNQLVLVGKPMHVFPEQPLLEEVKLVGKRYANKRKAQAFSFKLIENGVLNFHRFILE